MDFKRAFLHSPVAVHGILDHVNSFENVHELYNFNEKPPSMR